MTITLITQDVYNQVLDIYNKYPKLTYQNKDYDTLNLKTLTEEETIKFKEVEEVLRQSIKGFVKFNHFKIRPKSQTLVVRFQYNWTADEDKPSIPFTGVGYLELDELLNGFNK
jgi:hypothetical protein